MFRALLAHSSSEFASQAPLGILRACYESWLYQAAVASAIAIGLNVDDLEDSSPP
jgi:hypothetical protein